MIPSLTNGMEQQEVLANNYFQSKLFHWPLYKQVKRGWDKEGRTNKQ